MFALSWRTFAASIALVALGAPSTIAASSQSLVVGPRNAPPARTLATRSSGQGVRPKVTLCASPGANSFVGGGVYDVAGGTYAGIISGDGNVACGSSDAVGAGLQNFIFPNGGADYASFIGGGDENSIYSNGYGGTYQSFIGAGYANTVTAWDSGIGAGFTNLVGIAGAASFIGGGGNNTSNGEFGFVGAGQSNLAGGTAAFVGAGQQNTALLQNAAVVSGTSNQARGPFSFVGAGSQNLAGAVVLGTNTKNAFVGAGSSNLAYGNDSFVGAGSQNHALNDYSFVGAGSANAATAEYGVVAGGESNSVSGAAGAIGGGSGNNAAGEYATVPGGFGNSAAGQGSFAAGSASSALQNGTFVWSDGASTTGVKSSAPNQFLARASGGFFLYANAAATAGVKLAAGSGTWASLSDRTMKSAIVPLDPVLVLDKVAALPVSEWSYKSERGVRHVGPMAQDFYAAFGVGEDDRHITSIDEDGVALAAIKGLNTKTQREYDRLEQEHARLANALADLKTQVAVLARSISRETR